MQKTLGTTDSADLTDHVFDRRKGSECLPQLAQIGTLFPSFSSVPRETRFGVSRSTFAPDKLRSRPGHTSVLSVRSVVEVISAFPRKVLEIEDRRGAGRTSDRVGAAQA
jgi:hypothetical protein